MGLMLWETGGDGDGNGWIVVRLAGWVDGWTTLRAWNGVANQSPYLHISHGDKRQRKEEGGQNEVCVILIIFYTNEETFPRWLLAGMDENGWDNANGERG